MVIPRRQTLVVEPEQKNQTPYQYLCRQIPDAQPGFVRQLLRDGGVTVDGMGDALTRPLRAGAVITVEWPLDLYERARRRTAPAALPVLFEDARILVIDKPAGVSVVPERVRRRPTSRVSVGTWSSATEAPWPSTGRRCGGSHRPLSSGSRSQPRSAHQVSNSVGLCTARSAAYHMA